MRRKGVGDRLYMVDGVGCGGRMVSGSGEFTQISLSMEIFKWTYASQRVLFYLRMRMSLSFLFGVNASVGTRALPLPLTIRLNHALDLC